MFEVDPVDLIALEVLRAVEPRVYIRISQLSGVLTGSDRLPEEPKRAEITSLLDLVPESRKDALQAIVKELFPRAAFAFNGPGYGSDFDEEWFVAKRVCHPERFPTYFLLAPRQGDLSESEIQDLLSATSERDELVAKLTDLNERGLLGIALNRLEHYKQRIDIGNALPFITALFDVGDTLPKEPLGLTSVGADMHLTRVVHWYLMQEEDKGQRGRVLKQAIELTRGIYGPTHYVSIESSRDEKERRTEETVPSADLPSMRELCLRKIKEAGQDGRLEKNQELGYLLYRWREWGSEEEVRQWVDGLLTTEGGFLDLIRGFYQESESRGLEDYAPQVRGVVALKNLLDFTSRDRLDELRIQIDLAELSDRDRHIVERFGEAVEGKSEDW